MMRKILFSAALAVAATMLQAAQAHAYGGYHAGYTHVGPNGVQHAGYTAGGGYGGGAAHASRTEVGPGGGVYHQSATAGGGYGGGAYHTGTTAVGPGGNVYHSGSTGGYQYSPSYSGAAYGGVHVQGGYGAYGAYVR
jgi:hypothetical protein